MDKKLLDNMSGQEIKEMIDEKIICLEELDISALEKVLNFEINMLCLGTGDMSVIRDCSSLLEKCNSTAFDNTDIADTIDKVRNKYVDIDISKQEPKDTDIKKHCVLQRFILVAAVFSTIFAVTALSTSAYSYNEFRLLRDALMNSKKGDVIEYNGHTYINMGSHDKYDSIEEIPNRKKEGVLFPTALPEGIEISEICVYDDNIWIMTQDMRTSFCVDFDAEPYTPGSESTIYSRDGIDYDIQYRMNSYYAFSYYRGNYYQLRARTYEDLIFLIESLEEIK